VISIAIKAVIFDLDGTIAGFNLDYKALRGEIRSYLVRVGIPASVLSVKENIFDMLKNTMIYVKNNGKSAKDIDEIRNEALAIAEKYEVEAAASTDLLPGSFETLKLLKQMNLKIGLFTLNSDKAANYIIQRFKLGDFFGVTVPRNKVNFVKPNPQHLEIALKVLGVTSEETVVVGDGNVDMESAKELKTIAVGLTTVPSKARNLMMHGANYIITSITDLPSLIDKINKEKTMQ
jgi:HAD superfamily hydrolase (TIGR01549 family)